ncbi:MAG: hypothetical protein DRO10_02135 [Thermoprotei archaeon]|nr:MAG: hypothetical protein DRO10_02135 [Thermoprotei archaeon]
MIMFPSQQIMTTTPNEWEAGVVLAFLALFITFFVLSVLAIAIYLSSMALSKSKGKAVEKAGAVPTPFPPPEAEAVDVFEVAAAVAAVRHYLKIAKEGRKLAMVPHLQSVWYSRWLTEATEKSEINPYFLKKNYRSRGGGSNG